MMWQPMPEIAPFWLIGIGVLSPGAMPPQVCPPSAERMNTIDWPAAGTGIVLPWSSPQQVYSGPILPSRGLFGPPSGVWLLSTASQFLSSRNSASVSGFAEFWWTGIGWLHGWFGFLMFRLMPQPLALEVPPGESSTNAYALPSSSKVIEMSDVTWYFVGWFGSHSG